MATVRKRGKSYEIRVSNGYDINGKQKFQQMTWKPADDMTPKQIEKELNRQIIFFEENCLMKGQITSNVKFESIAEDWFDEYAKFNLRSTTYERMKQLTKRVYPAIGHLRLDRITGRHIQQFVNGLVTEVSTRTGKPLSRKTIVHHLSFISDIFSYAVKMGMISENPCSRVTVPKGEKKEKEIYTIEEIEQIFGLLEKAPLKYRVFFTLATYSGFRRGEMLGLEWKDIDWGTGVISVRRTSNYTKARGIYTDTTKTKKSQRSLKFPQLVIDLLREYKAEQDAWAASLGDKWNDHDRLFVKWNGEPMNPQTPYGWFKEDFCKANGIRFCDIHSLRHFNASVLINAGIDAAAVSSALGHSCIGTTTNIYCHVFQQAQARTSEAIAAALDFSKHNDQVATVSGLITA